MRVVDRLRDYVAIGRLGRGTYALKRFMATGQPRYIDEALGFLNRAVAGCPAQSKMRPACLTALGAALREHFNRSGVVASQEASIRAWEEALRLTPTESPDRPGALSNVAIGLFDRYARLGELADLEKAIACYEEALQVLPSESEARRDILNNLGSALRVRYAYDGNAEYLDKATHSHEEAVRLTPSGAQNLHLYLNNLGDDLRASYNRCGDLKQLDRAVESYEQASRLCPSTAPIRPMYLSNWGTALRLRYAANGSPSDVEQSITALTEAVQSSPANAPNLPTYLNNLGAGMIARFSATGNTGDLDRAVEVDEQAVELSPPGAPEGGGRRAALALALSQRYIYGGDIADLERAIQLHQQALQTMPQGGPDSLFCLNNLGVAYRSRFERTGDLADLQQAIDTYEVAKQQLLPGSPTSSACLANLGAALRVRYQRLEDPNDMDLAIQCYNDAINFLPAESPELPAYQNDLANGWNLRYEYTNSLDDLNAVIRVSAAAVKQCAHELPVYSVCCSTLGAALRQRYYRSNNSADLDAAVAIQDAALLQAAADSPLRTGLLNGLANSLSERYERNGNQQDLEQATTYYAEACQQGLHSDVAAAMMAATNWGNWALKRNDWAEAVKAYGFGLDALDRLFRTQLLRISKESWLREAGSLSASAAYALARTGDAQRAVEVLEHGHARLLSQVLERDRAELNSLREAAPEIHSRYISAINRLQTLELADVSGHAVPAASSLEDVAAARNSAQPSLSVTGALSEAMRQAREEVDEAVSAIREVAGYSNFLKPSAFDQIQQSTLRGTDGVPLVYFAVTRVGSLAFVVLPKHTGEQGVVAAEGAIVTVPLPELTDGSLRNQLSQADAAASSGYLDNYLRWKMDSQASAGWQTALDQTSHWLWSVAMGPLAKILNARSASRAVLIPQGLLGLLPLHAAWTEDTSRPTGRAYAMDTVAFSYAPNARALAACEAIAAGTAADSLLAIGDPQPITLAEPLPNALAEISAAAVTFPSATLLHGNDATRNAILAILQPEPGQQPAGSTTPTASRRANVWHFSCHGQARLAQPLESGLLLAADNWLTVRDLFAVRLSGVRLAILSACETGISGIRLPDELIGLPTGLVQAGVAGVVASLWSVNEVSTVLLLVRFYAFWKGQSMAPDRALQQAQMWLRDTRNEEKADYFKASLPEFGAVAPYALPVDVADALFQDMMLRPLGERDFEHPYYWAAFGLTGV